MKTLWQIFAIARTEFRFCLRRSAPVVMTALIGLIVGIGALLLPISTWQDWYVTARDFSPEKVEALAEEGYTPESYHQLVSRFSADWFSASGALLAGNLLSIALLLLPLATISAIPADRKFNVMEILRSTPITGGRYLAGKLLGVVSIIFLVGLATFLLFLLALEATLFYFLHFGMSISVLLFYLELSLMYGFPLLACGSAIGVLSGVVFRTRRSALFPGFIIGCVSLYLWLSVFKAPHSIFPTTDVAIYFVLQNFRSEAMTTMFELNGLQGFGLLGEGAATVRIGQVLLMFLVILLTFISITALARLWLRWKENF